MKCVHFSEICHPAVASHTHSNWLVPGKDKLKIFLVPDLQRFWCSLFHSYLHGNFLHFHTHTHVHPSLSKVELCGYIVLTVLLLRCLKLKVNPVLTSLLKFKITGTARGWVIKEYMHRNEESFWSLSDCK